jgi:hypothetical protein
MISVLSAIEGLQIATPIFRRTAHVFRCYGSNGEVGSKTGHDAGARLPGPMAWGDRRFESGFLTREQPHQNFQGRHQPALGLVHGDDSYEDDSGSIKRR